MKKYMSLGSQMALVIALILSVTAFGKSLRLPHVSSNDDGSSNRQGTVMLSKEGVILNDEQETEIYTTGSSLPDCSHACGPCFPCKRVKVSFRCEAVESCPVVYRCTCKGRYYHVPSN